MIRNLLALLLGILVGAIVVALCQAIGQSLYPLPANIDVLDPHAVRELARNISPSALVSVLIAWFIGIFAGTWTAARFARNAKRMMAMMVGIPLVSAGAATLLWFTDSSWLPALALALYLPAAWLGGKLGMALNHRPASSSAPSPDR